MARYIELHPVNPQPRLIGQVAAQFQTGALVAYTLFTSAVVFSIASISNDNLQDLKTGQLVDSTPLRLTVKPSPLTWLQHCMPESADSQAKVDFLAAEP